MLCIHLPHTYTCTCTLYTQLISQGAASSGLSELIIAIGRSQDPYDLSERIVPHLELLLKIDINIDKSECLAISFADGCFDWQELGARVYTV